MRNHFLRAAGRRLLYPTYVQDYLDRVTAADVAAGNTSGLELGVTDGANTFIQDLVSDTLLGVSGGVISQAASVIKASVPMAGARTRLGAMVPLVGPAPTSFNFVDADYNRKTGLVGNGTTKYLDSNRNNNADPQDSNHNAVYATNIGTTGAFMGANDLITGAGTGTNFVSRSGFTRNRNPTGAASPAAIAPGLFAMSRNASGSYIARVAQTNRTINDTSQVPYNSNVHVFQRPGNNVGLAIPTDARLAFYSIGESLDLALLDARVTTLINAYAAVIP